MSSSNLVIVSVTPFSGTTTPDKNGRMPVMLQCIAGRMPNRNVLSGTVAERQGFEIGKTYLAQVRKRGDDELFGPDFNFIRVKELETGKDIAEATMLIGDADIITIPRPDNWEQLYERKGDAVEGQRTKRIQEGKYRPSVGGTDYYHESSPEITEGTSTNSGGIILNPENDEKNQEGRK